MVGARSASPVGDDADGVGELLGADVLDQEAAGAGLHGLVDVLVEVEGGEDEDACGRGRRCRSRRVAWSPSSSGMRMSMRTTSGRELAGAVERLGAVARLADDLDVVLGFEDHAKAAAHERLVVGDQDADHGARPERELCSHRVVAAGASARLRVPAVDGGAFAQAEEVGVDLSGQGRAPSSLISSSSASVA